MNIKDFRTDLCIGRFKNNWRQRYVSLYPHPTDSLKVVSVGTPFDGSDPIICEEQRSAYGRQLVNGDWSDFD
jgi:hypothetical protein